MKRDDKFEQPLMLQPECVDCKWYDGFGQCLEHGNHLKDNCEDFEVCCEKEHALRLCEINKRDMTQARILAMLDDKYGTDLSMRFKKLDEEYNELREAVNRDVPNTLTLEHCVDYTRDILDELSDVNILIFHIAGIMGVSQDKLLSMAVDKIKGREKDPNYKRKHPHK